MEFRLDGRRRGAWNMAEDARMLAAARPAVRIYGWRPACVSLGHTQPEDVVDAAAASALGVDIVRRPTGGGALLHEEEEVTYAIVVPRAWVPTGMSAAYRRLSAGVVAGLGRLGVEAGAVEGRGGDQALCYLRGEGVSLAVGGRKISGGAQRRSRDAVLQHGTVLVARDSVRTARLLGGAPGDVAARTVCLRQLGVSAPWIEVALAVLQGFRDVWAETDAVAPRTLTA